MDVRPVDLGNGVWMIDLLEQGLTCRTAAYLILDEEVTLIETGSSLSHDTLLAGLAHIGVAAADLAHVIVTHVHLDHAGGAGHLMEKATRAQLVVHPRGARHMIDPSRLWQGAAQVYGDRVTDLFGSIVPVPASRVLVREHGDTLSIGQRTLTFFDSPGHAKHHFTILDPVADALYAGDALGVLYRSCFTGWDFEWVMPSSSPIDFDPVAVRHTVDLLRAVPFQTVYHAHFGPSAKAVACDETLRCADAFAQLIADVYEPGIELPRVITALRQWVVADLGRRNLPVGDIGVLDIDIILDAMGLLYYEEKRRRSD